MQTKITEKPIETHKLFTKYTSTLKENLSLCLLPVFFYFPKMILYTVVVFDRYSIMLIFSEGVLKH